MLPKHEILSPGEKILKTRKLIGANQKDLAGTQITRNLISQIENNKTKLVPSTAKIICNNIAKIIYKKGIKNITVTEEWLLEDVYTQANNIANDYIKELRKIKVEEHEDEFIKSKIIEVDTYIKSIKIDLKKQYEIHQVISELYLKLGDYCKCLLNLQKSFDLALKAKDYEEAVSLMIILANRLYSKDGSALESIRNLEITLNLYEEYNLQNKNILKKIYFNLALYYSILNTNDISIMYLEKLDSDFQLSISEQIDICLLKGNCYEESGDLEAAEKVYLEALDTALKHSVAKSIMKLYINLSNIYKKKDNKEKSIEYINYSLSIKSGLDEIYYAKALNNAIENYIDMNLEKLVADNFNRALLTIDNAGDGKMYSELIIKLYNFFINKKDFNRVLILLKKIDMNIRRKLIKDKYIINLFFKTSYKIKEFDIEKSKELFEIGINLLELYE